MASSQALGSGSECRTLPVGYEKQLFDSLCWHNSVLMLIGHISHLSNTWCAHYDCDTFLEIKLFLHLHRRCEVPVGECAFLSRGSRMSQWRWHSILPLTMFNCVTTARNKGACEARLKQIVETIPSLLLHTSHSRPYECFFPICLVKLPLQVKLALTLTWPIVIPSVANV